MQKNMEKLRAFLLDWKNQKTYMAWMIAQIKPFWALFLLILCISGCASFAGVYQTVVAKGLIDGATDVIGAAGSFRGSIAQMFPLVATMFGLIALYAFLDYMSSIVRERYSFAVRLRTFDRVIQSNWGWIASYHSGDMVTRLTSDVDAFANGTSSMIPDLFLLFVRLVSAFVVLYHYDRVLALTALVIGPVGAVSSILLGDKLKKYQVQLKETESKSLSLMQETISNISVIKAFSRERESASWLSGIRDQRMFLVKKKSKRHVLIFVGMQVVFSAGYLTAFAWGIFRLSTGSITFGTMSVFLSLAMQIQGPIMGLASMIPQFINVLASVGRVMEIEGQAPEPFSEEKVAPPNVGIRMRDVSFSYREDQILQNVDIDIRPGDRVGVVGYSGAGKTTLIRLILGFVSSAAPGQVTFYDESGGEEPASRSARRLVSYVPQGNSLQSGTILNNVRAGRADASVDEVWEALRIADADEFVRGLPKGLETEIGERAGGLSEGQAQRIAIARAVLKSAPVFILDEATSALDEKTERTVLERLYASQKIGTCILITHRRAMLAYCTRSLEIVNSNVIEYESEKK